MEADVTLNTDRGEVSVECQNLLVRGHDLLLDAPARRRPGAAGFRRAFVHDQDDGLTINFSGDYPGGVTVHGGFALAAIKPLSRDASDRPHRSVSPRGAWRDHLRNGGSNCKRRAGPRHRVGWGRIGAASEDRATRRQSRSAWRLTERSRFRRVIATGCARSTTEFGGERPTFGCGIALQDPNAYRRCRLRVRRVATTMGQTGRCADWLVSDSGWALYS